MKKVCAAMTSCMLALTLSVPAFANDMNVWIDGSELTVENSQVTANIYSDGTNTDGLLVIEYNPDELAVDESDVEVGSNIEMYSANVTKEGTLKIAYIAKESSEDDILFTLNFDATNKTLSKDAIQINGDVFNADGNELTVGMKNIEQTPQKPGGANTGDHYNVTMYAILGVVALGLIALSLLSRKSKKNG
ncbi:MAG: hypothetical protein ACI4U3_03565 [Traorella sp.]